MAYQAIPGGSDVRGITLTATAQNIDLTSLLPASPVGILRVTGMGPCGATVFVNVEVNTVASSGHHQTFSASAAWTASAANGPIATHAAGYSTFVFEIDARATASSRMMRADCETTAASNTRYTGGFLNTNTAVLTGLRLLGGGANAFSAGYRVTVEEL